MLALLLALSIRTASLASLVGAGPILAADAVRGLRRRAWLSPVWAIAIAVAVVRSGSSELLDVRGAHAVAGLALARGPAITVAGTWLAFIGTLLALVAWSPLGTETAGSPAARGRVEAPVPTRRLEAIGIVAEAALVVTLFMGPQIVEGTDAVWWVVGIGALVGGAWLARRFRLPEPASRQPAPGALAVAGLVLVLIGGPP